MSNFAEGFAKPRILVVDDHSLQLRINKARLLRRGYECVPMVYGGPAEPAHGLLGADSVDEVVRYAIDPHHRIAGVLTDIEGNSHQDATYGLSVIKALKTANFKGPIIAHSGNPPEKYAHAVEAAGGNALFEKTDTNVWP